VIVIDHPANTVIIDLNTGEVEVVPKPIQAYTEQPSPPPPPPEKGLIERIIDVITDWLPSP